MSLLLLAACAFHTARTGLVEPQDGEVELRGYDGRTWVLRLDAEAEPVRYLHGCIVEVEGPRVGRTVIVRDWRVTDAGDGSSGFVGTLRAYGSRLLIDDRNTGTSLVIDDETAPTLFPWVGRTVLLVGPVVGGGVIDVIAYRVLAPDGAAGGRSPG